MSRDVTVDAAFTAFVDANLRGWERLAFLLVGDGERSADLVQLVLLKVYRQWARISAFEYPDAYVRCMVTTGFLDLRRRRSSREIPVDMAGSADQRSGSRDPADTVSDRDLLRRALRDLTAAQRTVVVLRHVEELDDAAIAAQLNCSPATVRSHAAQGRARLRAAMTRNTTL